MKNMGLTRLVLVNPKCDRNCDQARQMAVHGIDVLQQAQIVDSLTAALTGCQKAIATTARNRSVPIQLESPKLVLPQLLTPDVESALLFGAEDRGLSNDELKYAQRFIYIDSNPEYPSLNLAQAVAVCVYELYQSYLASDRQLPEISAQAIAPISPSAPLEILEGYYQDLEAMLLEIGYLLPHTATVKMEKFRRLYNKANLQTEEVALLRGILRQIRWAIDHQSD